jgi:hypothetical protein
MKIAIITFIVGNDYKKAMNLGIQSKIEYAKKHGYDLHIGGDDVWDRSRPIPWSKLKYIEKFLDKSVYDYDYLFVSDADVLITNSEVKLESFLPLMEGKDLMWTYDVCDHFNSGHMFIKCDNGESICWLKSYFDDVWKCEELIHHIWWENAGMIQVFQTNSVHQSHIKTLNESWLFNAYLFDASGKAFDSPRRLWQKGDFLIHFAGVYQASKISQMMGYVQKCLESGSNIDRTLLENFLKV